MRKILSVMLLCAVILTGCQSAAKKTNTPAAPVHNVPPAVYPGSKSENPANADQAYPAPRADNAASTGDTYPAPGASAGQAPVTNLYAPAAGDVNLNRGNAFVEIENSQVILMESNPLQVKLHLKGSLPNPCCG
jgi:hypothetical protein